MRVRLTQENSYMEPGLKLIFELSSRELGCVARLGVGGLDGLSLGNVECEHSTKQYSVMIEKTLNDEYFSIEGEKVRLCLSEASMKSALDTIDGIRRTRESSFNFIELPDASLEELSVIVQRI